MRISTGQIIAVANGPGATGQDLALEAQVPPGSIFKMVTATNVLESGAETPNSMVNCPATLTVNGRTFQNSESEALGTVPLITDFAKSCNTAFASLYSKLGANGLATTAKQLASVASGRSAYRHIHRLGARRRHAGRPGGGRVRSGQDPGQPGGDGVRGRRGRAWPVEGAVAGDRPGRRPATPADGTALKPTTVTDLKAMMRAVITDGTAKNRMAGTPGGPVYAKTGTAQYDDNPDHTHAWFIGYQGDIAFAVLVVNGGFGATAAAPIAKDFLTTMLRLTPRAGAAPGDADVSVSTPIVRSGRHAALGRHDPVGAGGSPARRAPAGPGRRPGCRRRPGRTRRPGRSPGRRR